MLSLSGRKIFGNGEIYFDYKAGKFFPLYESSGQEELKKYLSTSLIHVPPQFDIIRILPWSVLHLPYNVQFNTMTDLDIRNLNKLFESEDYTIIEDLALLGHVPLDGCYHFYIPEASEKKEIALRVLDFLLNSGIIYETASDVLGPLYDHAGYSVNPVFPDHIKSGYRKFIRHLDGNRAAGYDPEYDAYDILSFRAGPVGEELAAFALGWRHTHAFPDNYLLYYRENNGTVYSLLEEMDVEAEKVISSSAGLRFTKALEIEDYVKKWIACYLPASYANQVYSLYWGGTDVMMLPGGQPDSYGGSFFGEAVQG